MRRLALTIALIAGLFAFGCSSGGNDGPAPDPDTHSTADGHVADGESVDVGTDVTVDVTPDPIDTVGDLVGPADAVADGGGDPLPLPELPAELQALCGERDPSATLDPYVFTSATPPELGAYPGMVAGDVQAVHFHTAHPLVVRTLRFYIVQTEDEPADIELHVFQDMARSRPDKDVDGLVPPIVRTVEETGWLEWKLDPPLVVMPDQHFWPGVKLVQDGGPQLAPAASEHGGLSLLRLQEEIGGGWARGQFEWFGVEDDVEFTVELRGEHVCALETYGFTDVTAEAGLADAGGRIVWGDVDGDRLPDLLAVAAEPEGMSRLFRNRGDGTFEDITETSGVQSARMALGLFLDADNDGDPDIYYSDYLDGDPPFPEERGAGILLNDGAGHFTELADSGLFLQGPVGAAAAADCDGDGNLDLFVGHWLAHYPQDPRPNYFYLGNGDGTFREASADVFGETLPSPTYGGTWGDFDDDGDQDLFVANYGGRPDQLWVNDGACILTNEAGPHRTYGDTFGDTYGTSFGIALGDYDNDGHLDMFTAAITHPRYVYVGSDFSSLRRSGGPPDYRFEDVTWDAGFVWQEGTIEPSFGDYDLDGDLDLFVSSTYPGQYSRLWRQGEDHRFADVTYGAGIVAAGSGDNTWVDYDRDGDLDLIVHVYGTKHILYRNDLDRTGTDESGTGGTDGLHFVNVELRAATPGNRTAVGARLTVKGAGPDRIREVRAGEGHYNSQPPLELHVGLGNHAGPVTLEVRWPDGTVAEYPDVAVDGFYWIEQGSAPEPR